MVIANQALHENTKVRGPGVEASVSYRGTEKNKKGCFLKQSNKKKVPLVATPYQVPFLAMKLTLLMDFTTSGNY